MPTRIITGGVGVLPGATMFERRQWFVEHLDDLRTLLMYEPRGHASMSGAILQPPTRPDADWGVLYIEVSGCLRRLLDAGLAIIDAINEQRRPVHPENAEIAVCHHVQLIAPGSDSRHSRHAMAIHPGWFDRSPCGTGTSARMAQLHARGQLPLHTDFVNESFIGTTFTGRLVEEVTVGDRPGVVPTITGRAWTTATAQYLLDPTDPFPAGFLL